MPRGTDLTRQLLGTFSDTNEAMKSELVVATIRSVSNGVVGVVLLQALALGVGFLSSTCQQQVFWLCWCCFWCAATAVGLVVLPVLAWVWLSSDGGTLANALGTAFVGGRCSRWLTEAAFVGQGRGDTHARRVDWFPVAWRLKV